MSMKTFIIRYPVVTYHNVTVVRDENITEDDLLDGITREELEEGESDTDCAWDTLKDAWREMNGEVFDEEYNYMFDD